jgi:hypothetical protein
MAHSVRAPISGSGIGDLLPFYVIVFNAQQLCMRLRASIRAALPTEGGKITL